MEIRVQKGPRNVCAAWCGVLEVEQDENILLGDTGAGKFKSNQLKKGFLVNNCLPIMGKSGQGRKDLYAGEAASMHQERDRGDEKSAY